MRTITYDEIKAGLESLAERCPNEMNPTDEDGGCIYFDPDSGRRCLIGALFFDSFDVDLHIAEGEAVSSINWNNRFGIDIDDGTAQLLDRSQRLADGTSVDGHADKARIWSEAVQLALNPEADPCTI